MYTVLVLKYDSFKYLFCISKHLYFLWSSNSNYVGIHFCLWPYRGILNKLFSKSIGSLLIDSSYVALKSCWNMFTNSAWDSKITDSAGALDYEQCIKKLWDPSVFIIVFTPKCRIRNTEKYAKFPPFDSTNVFFKVWSTFANYWRKIASKMVYGFMC